MAAIAPNLTVLVGELVGARLIAHAGSLVNLAKAPASTIQILGAEKALFRALKTKHETPKYGLIYHASLIGQAPPKCKGKISRVLAAKCALSTRVDALGESSDATIGLEGRMKVVYAAALSPNVCASAGSESAYHGATPGSSTMHLNDRCRLSNGCGSWRVAYWRARAARWATRRSRAPTAARGRVATLRFFQFPVPIIPMQTLSCPRCGGLCQRPMFLLKLVRRMA